MHIRLNGETRALSRRISIQDLLEGLGLDSARVAVELNRRILKRSEFREAQVEDGDELEVVTFVGGG